MGLGEFRVRGLSCFRYLRFGGLGYRDYTHPEPRTFHFLQCMGVSQNCGYLFGSPHNEGCSILGSIFGFPYLGKLPYSLTFT